MDDALDVMRSLLPGHDWELLGELGGSRRSVVHRVRSAGRTVILKQFTPGRETAVNAAIDAWVSEGWARESAALSVLPPGVRAPRPLVIAPSTVVMSDLGPGQNVADLLLGNDPAAAADGVVQWAAALALLHRETAGSRAAFREALARQGPAVAESRVDVDLADAAAFFEERYRIDVGDELRGLAQRLGGDGPAALTPADACPDNNILTPDGLALIDFEGAQWRHLVWDVAYLTVPWPTCWCAWRVPEAVLARAVETYRSAVGIPYVSSPQFDADLAAAAAAWTLMTSAWFLPRVLTDEPLPGRPGMPDMRAMIMHRLRSVRDQTALPELAGLAARVYDELVPGWGDVQLPYAPAFTAR